MKDFVLDASVALSWCFEDEATETTKKLLESLEKQTAYVPELWLLEVGNILVLAERRKRITYARISEYLTLIQALNIQIDTETRNRGFHEIFSLAYAEKLTTYDAAYLDLAMRQGLPLATKDEALHHAAKRLGVEIIK